MNTTEKSRLYSKIPMEPLNPLYKISHVLSVPVRKFKLANSKKEENRLISETLELVGLRPEDVLNKYPHQLSGGQRQRIMIARAFLIRPKLVIADEPVSMMDASLRAGILRLMLNLKRDWEISFIYITHDISTAYHISERMIIMYEGSITELGSAERIVKDPLHPYVKLLIESIPTPDPEDRWKKKIELPKTELSTRFIVKGCKFYKKCLKE